MRESQKIPEQDKGDKHTEVGAKLRYGTIDTMITTLFGLVIIFCPPNAIVKDTTTPQPVLITVGAKIPNGVRVLDTAVSTPDVQEVRGITRKDMGESQNGTKKSKKSVTIVLGEKT